jgi:HK97 family phage major capsid protein
MPYSDSDLQPLVDAIHDFEARRTFILAAQRSARGRTPAGGGYSIRRALLALQEDALGRDAPLEAAESARISELIGRTPRPGHAFVPVAPLTRDLNAATANQGGNFVASAEIPDVFVAALRASGIAGQFRIARPAVMGNVQFPRLTTGASTTWLASETATVTENQPAVGAVSTTPKTVGARFDMSRQLLKQITPAAERFLLAEAGAAVAGAVDTALIQGSGASGQPQGIVGTAGVATQSGTSLNWAGVLNAIEQVETANAIVNPATTGWVLGAAAAELLRARERAAGSGFILNDGRIAGFPVVVSGSVPASAAVFGDWSGVMLPEWGVLEIGSDPFTGFTTGTVTVRALWTTDVAVLRPASFATISSIT